MLVLGQTKNIFLLQGSTSTPPSPHLYFKLNLIYDVYKNLIFTFFNQGKIVLMIKGNSFKFANVCLMFANTYLTEKINL